MALWEPTELEDLRAWWDPDAIAQADASAVASWTSSVNSYALAQGTAANRPTLQTAEANGHNVVRFDGSNDTLTIASVLGLTTFPTYTFGVWNMANAVNQGLLQWGNFCGGQAINSGGSIECYNGASMTNAITKGAWRMTLVVNNGASSRIWIDGTLVKSGNSGSTFPAGTLVVGAAGNSTGPLNGDIAALLVVEGAPSTDDNELLFGWAAHRFGLSANLPADHTYKAGAPTVSSGFFYVGQYTGIQIPQATRFRLGS
jgi:hypothetical protein